MKKLLLFTAFYFGVFLFAGAQDYQISATGEYSVDPPKLDVYNGNVFLVFSTNYWFYKFPTDGPESPIADLNKPSSGAWPWATDISVNPVNGEVASIYWDYVYTPSSYACYLVKSSDGGDTWGESVVVDTVVYGGSLNNRTDMPKVKYSPSGNLYYLNYIDKNSQDTVAVYLIRDEYGKYRVDAAHKDKTKHAVSWFISENDGNDEVYVAYGIYDGKPIFYLKKYVFSASGVTEWEKEIYTGGNNYFDNTMAFSKLLKDSEGKLYFAFGYYSSQPSSGNGTYLFSSTDDGDNWNSVGQIDPSAYRYVELLITPNDNLVMFRNIEQNIYVNVSGDGGDTWTDTVRVNTAYGHAVGDFPDYTYLDAKIVNSDSAVIAWVDNRIDDRAGYEEIFGAKVSLPVPNTAIGEEAPVAINYTLLKNYPNPFNPSTEIGFHLNAPQKIILDVYDASGRHIIRLINGVSAAGDHKVTFNAENLSSGIYFAVLKTATVMKSIKMTLIK